jgi:hypothetical protein
VLGYVAFQPHGALRPGVPGCSDAQTTEAVTGMMGGALLESRLPGKVDLPTLSNIRQVGYASAQRQRGCTARLTIGAEHLEFGYTIAPSARAKGEFMIAATHPKMVEQRFGHLTRDGDFANNADPIGRQQVRSAMRAGVDAMGGAMPMAPVAPIGMASNANPDRRHPVADVESLGACREVRAGLHYRCRLMVEYTRPIDMAYGLPPSVFSGEFSFVRAPGAPAWRVTDAFSSELSQASRQGRLE